jgi:hypothetical protein
MVYYFKPAEHWNVIPEAVWHVLVKFYGQDLSRLRIATK